MNTPPATEKLVRGGRGGAGGEAGGGAGGANPGGTSTGGR